MSRFLTRCHRRLMHESEQCLLDASQSSADQKSRISRQILTDRKLHLHWESRHAKLLLPVAEHRKASRQIIDLRLASIRLVHSRALVEYIHDHQIRGEERRRFFSRYYGPMEYQNAVLAAHRRYMLSMSSSYSTRHLIDLMFDPVTFNLLERYELAYRQYFELNSYVASIEDASCAAALVPFITMKKKAVTAIRQELVSVAPDPRCREIEKQACLARSGRYPALNYLLV